MALLMSVRRQFAVHTHIVTDGGKKGRTLVEMVEEMRFAFNEGRAGRRTVDDAKGWEAGLRVRCRSSLLPMQIQLRN